jgi:dolichyl-phosphate beta-glucosyltransferase
MTTIELSIIIPAYNEARRLPKTLEAVQAYFQKRIPFLSYEILVVDDGSSDETVQKVLEAQAKAPQPERLKLLQNGRNRGKGFSIRHGFQKAQGKDILFSDADLSTPIEEIEKMLPSPCSVVIASRSLPDSDVQITQGPIRLLMGKVFGALSRTLVLPGIQDSQCGFKLFRRPVVQRLLQLPLCVDGFAFDVEILYLVKRLKFSIQEVPVRWLNVEGTKVNAVIEPFRMFYYLLFIRFYHRRLPLPSPLENVEQQEQGKTGGMSL